MSPRHMAEIGVRIVHFSIANGTTSAITPKTSESPMNLINHFDNPSELHLIVYLSKPFFFLIF